MRRLISWARTAAPDRGRSFAAVRRVSGPRRTGHQPVQGLARLGGPKLVKIPFGELGKPLGLVTVPAAQLGTRRHIDRPLIHRRCVFGNPARPQAVHQYPGPIVSTRCVIDPAGADRMTAALSGLPIPAAREAICPCHNGHRPSASRDSSSRWRAASFSSASAPLSVRTSRTTRPSSGSSTRSIRPSAPTRCASSTVLWCFSSRYPATSPIVGPRISSADGQQKLVMSRRQPDDLGLLLAPVQVLAQTRPQPQETLVIRVLQRNRTTI